MLQVTLRGIVSWVPGISAENVAIQDQPSSIEARIEERVKYCVPGIPISLC